MAKKTLFWTVTILLVLITAFVLTITVILPIADKNPLAEAIPKSVAKTETKAKKPEKSDIAPGKGGKNDKNAKRTEVKAQNSQSMEEPLIGSKDDLLKVFELKKNETTLKAHYSLAAEDSMYLVLDLVKRTAIIEMKGIPLHDSPLKEIWMSNSIKMFHSESLVKWISQPFVLKNAISTIERVQFLVKNAPKDTIEANKADAIPAPRRTEDVYIVMNFERNLQLVIQQSEISEGSDKARIDSIKSRLFKSETEKSVKALLSMRRESVPPKIVITLPKADAITLYRALPQKLKMILKM
jgi:hypothetical protein